MSGILEVDDLTVRFRAPIGLRERVARRADAGVITALDRVTLHVDKGAALGIVGESGCGKSTLARTVVGLVHPAGGTVRFREATLTRRRSIETRRAIQLVFQDPSSALDPRYTVRQTLAELLAAHAVVPSARIDERCRELLAQVELSERVLDRRSPQLSGGQRQRVSIARALALEPEVLIADEVVSALDVSVQASILNLLNRLRVELGLTLVFISHDLAAVRQVCDEIAVMYLGRIAERRQAHALLDDPQHPYARALVAAAPRLDVRKEPGTSALRGEPPIPSGSRVGCAFAGRCAQVVATCRAVEPALVGPASNDLVACHVTRPEDGAGETP